MEANGLKSDLIIDGQKLLISSPQRTPVVTRMITPSPTCTPTPIYRYPAPTLLWPADGAEFLGRDTRIILQWTSVAILQLGEWYEVRVWLSARGPADATRFYTQASILALPASAYPEERGGDLAWTVTVVYRARTTVPAGPAADSRRIRWR
jgi:hypothetical protein